MTQHAHALLPLIWSSAERSPVQSGPVGLGPPGTDGDDSLALPLTGLYGLLLRYGGPRDVALWLRPAATVPWRSLQLRYSAISDGSALGPTLQACQQALRETLRSHPGPGGREALATGSGLRTGTGRLTCEVALPAVLDEGDTAVFGRAGAPGEADDAVVFVLTQDSRSGWSVSLRSAFTPADPKAPARMLAHLAAFVSASVASPRARVGEVAYLSAPETRLADQLNDPPEAVVRGDAQCIHTIIEHAAWRYPGKVALIQGAERVTFRQLDEKANAIAAEMITRGISRGDRVGILAARSAEFVVAALAVMKAGAAYVPLDPLLPAVRLSTLFRIGSVRLLLAEHFAQEVASGLTGAWMAIPPVRAIEELPGHQLPAPVVGGKDLAYIIFTSGSTGTPKGVLLDHYGRVNLLADLNNRVGNGPDDRILANASPSFDASVMEIFGPLAAGTGVVLPDRGHEYDVAHWVELVRDEGVTVWNSVPSLLTAFLRAWEHDRRGTSSQTPGPLRAFVLGGDWIPLEQPSRIWAAFPGAQIHAIGGNTEVSVCSTIYPFAEVKPDWRSIPYGRALSNQTLYVLDPFGELAAPDLAGEVALGGVGVGWGYDSNPRLTAERFVPDPFGPLPGARLYLTGDRGRLRPDGFVELLGRLDQQVKIEGVRIELGEIQACLCRQPEVAEGVVVPRRAADGRVHSLVGFVVPAAGPATAGMTSSADGDQAGSLATVLRERMAAELPRPMVPQRVMVLDSLPLNSNGKVDQRALQALAAAGTSTAPRGPRPEGDDEIVRAVSEVWAEVLGTDTLPGADEVFADLGGGSLAAMQVASRLRTRFNADIKVADLFTTATAAEIASLVRASQQTSRPMPALVRRRKGPHRSAR